MSGKPSPAGSKEKALKEYLRILRQDFEADGSIHKPEHVALGAIGIIDAYLRAMGANLSKVRIEAEVMDLEGRWRTAWSEYSAGPLRTDSGIIGEPDGPQEVQDGPEAPLEPYVTEDQPR